MHHYSLLVRLILKSICYGVTVIVMFSIKEVIQILVNEYLSSVYT